MIRVVCDVCGQPATHLARDYVVVRPFEAEARVYLPAMTPWKFGCAVHPQGAIDVTPLTEDQTSERLAVD